MKLRNRKTGEIWDIGKVLTCDYPTESLIKDENIRDIIRSWTRVNGVVGLTYNAVENSFTDIFRNEISFNGCLDLEDGGFYTTKELCGEDEQ